MLHCQLPVAGPAHVPMEQAAFRLHELEQGALREGILAGAGSSWGQGSYDASLAAMLFPEIAPSGAHPLDHFDPQAQPSSQPLPKPEMFPSQPLSDSTSHRQSTPASCRPTSPFTKAEDSPGELSHAPQQYSEAGDSPPDLDSQLTQQQQDEDKAERLRAKNRHAQQRYRERKVKYRDSQKRCSHCSPT